MNKVYIITALVLILLSNSVYATCTINPTTWDINLIKPGETKSTTFTIIAENDTCDVTSDTNWITFSKTHFVNTTASFNAILSVPSTAELNSYTNHIKVNSVSVVTVSYTVSKQEKYGLEAVITKLILQIEEGATTKRTLTVRNRYPDDVEIRDINLLGVTITENGTKPISIPEATLGILHPGRDFSFDIMIDGNVKAGTYTPSINIIYYDPEGNRQELRIDTEITVIKSISPHKEEKVTKPLELDISPQDPLPNEYVSVTLKDAQTKEIIQGTVKVLVYSGNELTTQFVYYSPFKTELNKKYCINATAEGYDSVQKCFLIELGKSKIL